MIDTHCHLTFPDFSERVDTILENARGVGVRGIIAVATTPDNARCGLDLAQKYENVWCTAGIHPLYADESNDPSSLPEIMSHPKCVAWGELGLDHHYDKPPRSDQLVVLEKQLAMIDSCDGDHDEGHNECWKKPVVVHSRKSFDDLLAIFRTTQIEPSRFVFHCFTGNSDEAKKVLDFGAWISFTGVVTFSNAPEVAAAAKIVPADRIMVETDAPFLTPEPHRKTRPNEPKFVVHTARRLAELRGVSPEDFERQLDANAERFFGITLPE